jgi:transcriptional antiterminator NusG
VDRTLGHGRGGTAVRSGAAFATASSPEAWFAVWTRNQYEPRVSEQLRRKCFEVFLPTVRIPSRRRDRRIMLDQPLFPGYLFLRFAPSRAGYVAVASTDGVVRVLGDAWDALQPVPDDQVDAVRRLVTGAEDARAVPWIHLGDRVRILDGPLAGLEGLVRDRRRGRATFVVNVDLLQRSVGVEVEAALLERC